MKKLVYNLYHATVCNSMWWLAEGTQRMRGLPGGHWLWERTSIIEYRANKLCMALDEWVVDKDKK